MKPAKKSSGLAPKMFRGVSTKDVEARSGNGKRLAFDKDNPTVTVQFLEAPEEWARYENHSFQEDGQWQYVPCTGDGCPLCDADDTQVSRTSFRFLANVYSFSSKRVQLLEGPKTMAQRIIARHERKPALFKKRVYDITKIPGTPVSYDVDLVDDTKAISVTAKLLDPEEYIVDQLKRYYGDEMPDLDSANLEDEEDEEEEDDLEDDEDVEDVEGEDDEEEDEDEEDDEEDDEDEDDEEDEEEDEEEDDEPAPRHPAKKVAAKKAVAKKAAPVKKAAPAKRVARRS